MSIQKFFVICLTMLVLVGCVRTSPTRVAVNGINNNSPTANIDYVLLPGTIETSDNTLQYQEYVSYIKNALALKGMNFTEDTTNADIVILVSYGKNEPKVYHHKYAQPVYGQTGISSSNTTGNTFLAGGNAYHSSTTKYTPTYGITGYVPAEVVYTFYPRWIELTAYDLEAFNKSKKLDLVWNTKIAEVGDNPDFRMMFPIMLAAAVPYISENTKQTVDLEIYEYDEKILKIKGESREPSPYEW